jgi:hypothetical protein
MMNYLQFLEMLISSPSSPIYGSFFALIINFVRRNMSGAFLSIFLELLNLCENRPASPAQRFVSL